MIRFHDPRAQIGVEIESYGLSYDVRASADIQPAPTRYAICQDSLDGLN